MLHMSGVGAARLLAEPGDHPPAAGPVGTRGLLQTHPQCRGFLPTPQVSVLTISFATHILSKYVFCLLELFYLKTCTCNIDISTIDNFNIVFLTLLIFEGVMPL